MEALDPRYRRSDPFPVLDRDDGPGDWTARTLYIALSLCIFLVDVFLPSENAAAVPYVAVILLTLVRRGQANHALEMAAVTTALALTGYILSATSAGATTEVYNRLTAVLAIWMLAFAGSFQKRERKLVREAKEMSERILAAVRQPLIVLDQHQRVVRVNDAFRSLFPTDSTDVTGQPFRELENADWKTSELQEIVSDASSHVSLHVDYEIDRDFPSMGRRVLRLSARPIPQLVGTGGRDVIVAVEDITDHRKKQESLLAAERKYRDLYDNAPDMYGSVDPQTGGIKECNQTLCSTLGYAKAELIGRPVSKIYHRDCHARVGEALQTFGETGEVHNAELDLRRKNGTKIPVLLNASAVRDQAGRILHCRSVWRDITERRRGLEASRMLATIVSHSADAICSIDLAGTIVSWNQAGEAMYGYTENEILGQDAEIIVPTHLHKEWYAIMDRVASGEGIRQFETSRATKHGRLLEVSLTLSPTRDPSGEIVGAAMIARDITARKEAECRLQTYNSELQERTAQLQEVNQDLERFSYSVSHDLRAPLRAIGGYAEVLLEDSSSVDDEQSYKALRVIARNAEKMDVLIESLLRFSRLGRQPLRCAGVNMSSLAQEAFEQACSLEAGRTIHCDVRELPTIQGDTALLRQVWANLLGNAVKYTRPQADARIIVRGNVEDGMAVYSVIDNGVGFDEEHAEALFGVFQRLHSSSDFEGTGVGLALAQRIIERHGGRIWARSTKGKGAEFSFALPREEMMHCDL